MTDTLRLLFLPQCRLSHELGGSKIQLALAEHLRRLGWQVDCRFPFDPADPLQRAQLAHYDVVDWDPRHALDRRWLPPTSLSICRFALLAIHFQSSLPWPLPWQRRLDPLIDPFRKVCGRTSPTGAERHAVEQALLATKRADVIAVMNTGDRACLEPIVSGSIPIVVEPCGLSHLEHQALQQIRPSSSASPVLAFLGSFDPRKGCLDLVWIARRLVRRFPGLEVRLIGTNGLLQGEAAVRRCFPVWLQPHLRVVPTFSSSRLSEQLQGVSLGVFPSYLEGFGIAVIEQLAAGVPVMAYAAPGPADILPAEWLAPRGDRHTLIDRLSVYLADPAALLAASERARLIAAPYRWDAIAGRWDIHYRSLLAQRRA